MKRQCEATVSGNDALAFAPTPDPEWLLVEEGFNLAREHEIESLFSVSNGYIGSRGSLAEGSTLSAPATFVAGIYAYDPDHSVALAAAPDWMSLHARLNGKAIKIEGSESLHHCRILDMRQGMMWRDWRFEDPSGRIAHVLGARLASLDDRHLLIQVVSFTPENYSGRIRLESSMAPMERPGRIALLPVSVPMASCDGSVCAAELHTGHGVLVAFASNSQVAVDGREVKLTAKVVEGAHERWEVDLELGKTYRLTRLVAVYTTRDSKDPVASASRHLEQATSAGIDRLLAAHTAAWHAKWQHADVVVAGDSDAQRALRFAAYHLIGAANPEDEHVSIAARALTGAAYKGHVFWDTEIFMLPFHIFTHPPSARALLMYRYHTLGAARENAQSRGYQGALYAWESADTGKETTPRVAVAPDGEVVRLLSGEQEHHISADVAYAVWQYWTATGNDDFFLGSGAEIMLETARFWASRGGFASDGLYHIRAVVGPDEYHEGVDDNAYTNGMAQWNLERGVETAAVYARRWPRQWRVLIGRLQIADTEIQRWSDIARRMYTGLNSKTGLIEQFQGYFRLENIDLKQFAKRKVPMDVLLGRRRIQGSQIIKQADVLMLIYLLWERYAPRVRRANFDYYELRCGHGSSLSPSIHALLAARLGNMPVAERYFRQAREIDLANNMGNAAGGVHVAAQGGLWQSAVFGFGGARPCPDGLAFQPNPPAQWRRLQYALQWRGQTLRVTAEPKALELVNEGDSAIGVAVATETPVELAPGQPRRWTQIARHYWQEAAL